MKNGQVVVKEFTEFLKERTVIEEDYVKHLIKLAVKISNYNSNGSFGPIWSTLKTWIENLTQLNQQLVIGLQDLSKELHKYSEEQQKTYKSVKTRERTTFETVNSIQTTTTILQKSKENYHEARLHFEKLKLDSAATPKEKSKAETKVKKTGDEYKSYIEKYSKVRDEFVDKMRLAAKNFQEMEQSHLERMQAFVVSHAGQIDNTCAQTKQACDQFCANLDQFNPDALLRIYADKHGTGKNMPDVIVFEEPDLSALESVIVVNTESPANAVPPPRPPGMTVSPTPGTFDVPGQDLIMIDGQSNDGSSTGKQDIETASQTSAPSIDENLSTTKSMSKSTSKLSLGLRGWGRNRKGSSKPTTPVADGATTPSATSPVPTYAPVMESNQNLLLLLDSPQNETALPPRLPQSEPPPLSSGATTPALSDIHSPPKPLSMTVGAKSEGAWSAPIQPRNGPPNSGKYGDRSELGLDLPTIVAISVDDSKFDDDFCTDKTITPSTSTAEPMPAYDEDDNHSSSSNSKVVLRTKQANSPGITSKSPDDATNRKQKSLSMGFLRKKRGKKNKRKESTENGPSGGDNTPTAGEDYELDDEGYVVRRDDDNGYKQDQNKFYSSSDDSDDEAKRKIHVEIKPAGKSDPKVTTASISELYAASAGLSSLKLNSSDPFSNHSSGYGKTTPDATNDGSNSTWKLNAFSLTGNSSFASDKLNQTLPASMGGTARARPRPTTPVTGLSTGTGGNAKSNGIGGAGVKSSYSSQPLSSRHRSDSTDSLGDFGPQSSSTHSTQPLRPDSRGPSPLTLGHSDSIPLAMALTETIHALFKGADPNKCQVKAEGLVAVAFPAGIMQAIASNPHLPVLSFQLIHSGNVTKLKPNPALIASDSHVKTATSHQYSFNMPVMVDALKTQALKTPTAPHYSLNVLMYEVSAEHRQVPVELTTFWKCTEQNTDIRVDYSYNDKCILTSPLLNLVFSTTVDGGAVQEHQSEPASIWNAEKKELKWKLTELSRHGEGRGSLKARLIITDGPSKTSKVNVQFQANDANISGSELQLTGSGYRLSLQRRKLVSGKYYCEPEVR